MFFLAPDGDGGSGGGDAGTTTATTTTTEPQTLEEFLKGKPDAERESLTKLFEKQTAAMKSALDKERDARETAEKERKRIEREHAKAADAKLAEEKKFEELATQREKRLGELEPEVTQLKADVEKYKAEAKTATDKVQELVEQQIKVLKLDEAVTELLNGKTAVEKLDWIVKHAEKLGKSGGLLPVTPKGDTDAAKISDEEAKKLTARTW